MVYACNPKTPGGKRDNQELKTILSKQKTSWIYMKQSQNTRAQKTVPGHWWASWPWPCFLTSDPNILSGGYYEDTDHAQYPGGVLTEGCHSFSLLVVSAEQSLGQFSSSPEVFWISTLSTILFQQGQPSCLSPGGSPSLSGL